LAGPQQHGPGTDRQSLREDRRRNRPHQGNPGSRPEGGQVTEQNAKIDGRTKRAADLAIAKRTISRASYDALLAGRIGLAEAKSIGRDGAPATDNGRASDGPGRPAGRPRSASADGGQGGADTPPRPLSRISKDDTRQLCWCGCQELTSPNRKWRPGHDQRGKGIIRQAVKEGKVAELSPQLKEYGAERRLL
jgi:hypothetical protein